MPLHIELKPSEKIFVNGAVIANGPTRSQFAVLNNAQILREKDILTEELADTPCKRVYFLIQLIYMDRQEEARGIPMLLDDLDSIVKAAPSTTPYINEILQMFSKTDFYRALRAARKLIDHEKELLTHAR